MSMYMSKNFSEQVTTNIPYFSIGMESDASTAGKMSKTKYAEPSGELTVDQITGGIQVKHRVNNTLGQVGCPRHKGDLC